MISFTGYDFEADIHMYRWKDLNILLDVNSGAVHLLDDMTYKTVEQIIACKGDTYEAIKNLTPDFPYSELRQVMLELVDIYKKGAVFTKRRPLKIDLLSMPVKALCLNVAHACNMQCRYCFASQGSFGMKPSLMSLETGKKAVDFLLEKSGDVKNLEIDFFGGEPLLVFDMLKELVSYCRRKEKETGKIFNFTLTTNCLLLSNEVINWIISNNISVILSLDGRKQTNDKNRLLCNGEGTYDLIVPRIKKMIASKPVSYYVRGTFTRENLDFSNDLMHMVELGFESLSLEPAVGPENDFSIKEEDIPRVLEEYERLTDVLFNYYILGKNINFFHYDVDLLKGPCIAKRSTGCGAGIEYLVITPEGDIYPCHQFVGEEVFYMGNIHTGEFRTDLRNTFADNQLVTKEACRKCWARYFCGGGCHANAYYTNGDISKPSKINCTMHKKRIEGAIYLQIQKQISTNSAAFNQ